MKKPEAVRLEQAPSAVSRLFRDCFAILGLLRRPPPDLLEISAKHGCNPRDRNDGFSRQCCFSSIAATQACSFPVIFCVAAYFWSTIQVKPYPINRRRLLVSVFKPVRPLGFQRDEIPLAQDHKGLEAPGKPALGPVFSAERAGRPRTRRPLSYLLANFCFPLSRAASARCRAPPGARAGSRFSRGSPGAAAAS